MPSNPSDEQLPFIQRVIAGDVQLVQLDSGIVIPHPAALAQQGLSIDSLVELSVRHEPGNAGVLRYVNEYMTADDYLLGLDIGNPPKYQELTKHVLNSHPRDVLLRALGVLALSTGNEDNTSRLIGDYIYFLQNIPGSGQPAELIRNTLTRKGERSFLVRQFILAAFRLALCTPDDSQIASPVPAVQTAVLLTHLLAMGSQRRGATPSNDTLGGMSEDLAMEMVRNHVFYQSEDLISAVDRTVQLWRTHGLSGSRHLGEREPADVLKAATGIEVEDFLALGLAIALFGKGWNPETQGVALAQYFGTHMEENVHLTFLDHISLDKDGFAEKFNGSFDELWNFLPFEEFPLLKIDDQLIIIDQNSLLQRFTSGLFWFVFDHLRNAEQDAGRNAWGKAWGQMVEDYSEELLKMFAPTILDNQASLYTEEDLRQAYPGDKAVDIVIDFGTSFGAFEIVSSRLTVPTRIGGSRAAFDDDMNKIVFPKIKQLDTTAKNLIENESYLTSISTSTPRHVQPILVAGGGFPVSIPTMNYIREWCRINSMLQHPSTDALAIIELDELEILVGFAEHGHSPIELLAGWQNSDLANISLKNYLFEQYPISSNSDLYRPSSVRPRMEQTLQNLVSRLGLQRN